MSKHTREISPPLGNAPVVYPHVAETIKQRVNELYESQNALSTALGITRQAIWARVVLATKTDKIHPWWEKTLLLPEGALASTNTTDAPFSMREEAPTAFGLAVSRVISKAYIACASRWEEAYRATANRRRPITYDRKRVKICCPHCGGKI